MHFVEKTCNINQNLLNSLKKEFFREFKSVTGSFGLRNKEFRVNKASSLNKRQNKTIHKKTPAEHFAVYQRWVQGQETNPIQFNKTSPKASLTKFKALEDRKWRKKRIFALRKKFDARMAPIFYKRLRVAEKRFTIREKREVLFLNQPKFSFFSISNPLSSVKQSSLLEISNVFNSKSDLCFTRQLGSYANKRKFPLSVGVLNGLLFPNQFDILNIPCFGNVLRFTKELARVGIREQLEPMLRLREYRRKRFSIFKSFMVAVFIKYNSVHNIQLMCSSKWLRWAVGLNFSWLGLMSFYMRKRWWLRGIFLF